MATSDEAEYPGQPPLEPTIKDTLGALFNHYASIQNLNAVPENVALPEKRGLTISNSERPLEIQMALIDGERKVQGVISATRSEEPLGGMYNHTPTS